MKLAVTTLAIGFLLAAALMPAFADAMEGMDMGGDSSSNTAFSQMGKHMHMGLHMTMTPTRSTTPEDTQRARQILQKLRETLTKYQDYKAAEADGYEPYMESVPQDVYHFANRQQTAAEYLGDVDIARPGSLLYEKKLFGGYKLVGAMYSAPASYTPNQLDEIIPLGLAQWHAHTNICLPRGMTEEDVMAGRVMRLRPDIASVSEMHRGYSHGTCNAARMRMGYFADDRFGFQGTIADQPACESAGGTFHQQIFGWMVHVYPFAGDDLKVTFGQEAP